MNGSSISEADGEFLKRLFDIFLSVMVLIFSAPLVLLIGALIKLTSRGPIFYAHRRLGKGRRYIKVYKFRTMDVNAEAKLARMLEENSYMRDEFLRHFKLKDDPRLTKFGRVLRKYSLDELPQFWNVIKGEMTLVGPRPIVDDEVERYGVLASRFFDVKPGLTGYWQVSGRNDTTYDERVKMDMWYIDNRSLTLDSYILAKTLTVFWKGHGAY
jgi:undecaprenyl-phosphate galactose phosphotransferase